MARALRIAGLLLGIAAFLALALGDHALARDEPLAARAAGACALMAIWWLFEALPIYVTACVPLVLFLPLGVVGATPREGVATLAHAYLDPYIFLFLGGMGIGAAMQRWNLHRRIALAILMRLGAAPRRAILGVLVATAFVSLWLSNTASAAMMLPIAVALVARFEEDAGGARLVHLGSAIVLAVAWGANLGGLGTKIGTAPNAQLASFLSTRADLDVTFLAFAAIGVPFLVLALPIAWTVLWREGRRDAPRAAPAVDVLVAEARALGPLSSGERRVLAVFAATALTWILSQPITRQLDAWLPDAGLRSSHVEGGAAMLALLALFVLRAQGRALLDLRALLAQPLPTLLLLGGSFALAAAIRHSGLDARLAAALAHLSALPFLAQLLAVSGVTVALSALASNTATVAIALNVLWAGAAPEHAVPLLFTATLAGSLDFALPVGTPPNAIVFGSGYLTVPRMARLGVVLDVLLAILCALWCAVAVRALF